MKILHVLYSGLGGHGNVFFSMVQADKAREFTYEALFNGIEDIREEYRQRCQAAGINWAFVKKKAGFDPGFYMRLMGTIRKIKPDIIFLHGSTQVFWARVAAFFSNHKCRIIVRETQANHLKTKQDWLWLSVAMVVSGKIVFLTEAYRDQIRKKLAWLYREKKIRVIPNGINLEQFHPAVPPAAEPLVIGMQSRVVPIKDHATLLHAFAGLVRDPALREKKMELRIAGDGESRAGLEDLARKLGIERQVIFLGMIAETELVGFLHHLHIYVHASFGETMSTAIMQAMACGKPVVASDVPGISNMIIDGETGLLVPAGNAAEWQRMLQQLITDPGLQVSLARNAEKYAIDNFSNEIMFARYKTLF